MQTYTARVATAEDLPAMLDIAARFTAESALPYAFSRDAANRTFWHYVHADESEVLLVETVESLAGGAIVAADRDFTEQPFGYLIKFYVLPYHRRTRAARTLIRACVDWFDGRDCADAWATATAGIGEDAAFVALLRKAGFAAVGPMLRRLCHG